MSTGSDLAAELQRAAAARAVRAQAGDLDDVIAARRLSRKPTANNLATRLSAIRKHVTDARRPSIGLYDATSSDDDDLHFGRAEDARDTSGSPATRPDSARDSPGQQMMSRNSSRVSRGRSPVIGNAPDARFGASASSFSTHSRKASLQRILVSTEGGNDVRSRAAAASAAMGKAGVRRGSLALATAQAYGATSIPAHFEVTRSSDQPHWIRLPLKGYEPMLFLGSVDMHADASTIKLIDANGEAAELPAEYDAGEIRDIVEAIAAPPVITDLTQLSDVKEASMNYTLHRRYLANQLFVQAGTSVLVVTNPYRELPALMDHAAHEVQFGSRDGLQQVVLPSARTGMSRTPHPAAPVSMRRHSRQGSTLRLPPAARRALLLSSSQPHLYSMATNTLQQLAVALNRALDAEDVNAGAEPNPVQSRSKALALDSAILVHGVSGSGKSCATRLFAEHCVYNTARRSIATLPGQGPDGAIGIVEDDDGESLRNESNAHCRDRAVATLRAGLLAIDMVATELRHPQRRVVGETSCTLLQDVYGITNSVRSATGASGSRPLEAPPPQPASYGGTVASSEYDAVIARASRHVKAITLKFHAAGPQEGEDSTDGPEADTIEHRVRATLSLTGCNVGALCVDDVALAGIAWSSSHKDVDGQAADFHAGAAVQDALVPRISFAQHLLLGSWAFPDVHARLGLGLHLPGAAKQAQETLSRCHFTDGVATDQSVQLKQSTEHMLPQPETLVQECHLHAQQLAYFLEAAEKLGFSDTEVMVAVAMIHLVNIQFISSDAASSVASSASTLARLDPSPRTQAAINAAAHLLGMPGDELRVALTSRMVDLHGERIKVPLPIASAHRAVRQLVNFLMQRLTDWIVARVNHAFATRLCDNLSDRARPAATLRIVDGLGFEVENAEATEANTSSRRLVTPACLRVDHMSTGTMYEEEDAGLERLFHNTVAEHLYAIFCESLFVDDAEMLRMEGVAHAELTYRSNQPVVDAIEDRASGILAAAESVVFSALETDRAGAAMLTYSSPVKPPTWDARLEALFHARMVPAWPLAQAAGDKMADVLFGRLNTHAVIALPVPSARSSSSHTHGSDARACHATFVVTHSGLTAEYDAAALTQALLRSLPPSQLLFLVNMSSSPILSTWAASTDDAAAPPRAPSGTLHRSPSGSATTFATLPVLPGRSNSVNARSLAAVPDADESSADLTAKVRVAEEKTAGPLATVTASSSTIAVRAARTSMAIGRGAAAARSTESAGRITGAVARFRANLAHLLGRIEGSDIQHIICIRPSLTNTPKTWDMALVDAQLRCLGILDCVAAGQKSFSVWMQHEEFYKRFWCLWPPVARTVTRLHVPDIIARSKVLTQLSKAAAPEGITFAPLPVAPDTHDVDALQHSPFNLSRHAADTASPSIIPWLAECERLMRAVVPAYATCGLSSDGFAIGKEHVFLKSADCTVLEELRGVIRHLAVSRMQRSFRCLMWRKHVRAAVIESVRLRALIMDELTVSDLPRLAEAYNRGIKLRIKPMRHEALGKRLATLREQRDTLNSIKALLDSGANALAPVVYADLCRLCDTAYALGISAYDPVIRANRLRASVADRMDALALLQDGFNRSDVSCLRRGADIISGLQYTYPQFGTREVDMAQARAAALDKELLACKDVASALLDGRVMLSWARRRAAEMLHAAGRVPDRAASTVSEEMLAVIDASVDLTGFNLSYPPSLPSAAPAASAPPPEPRSGSPDIRSPLPGAAAQAPADAEAGAEPARRPIRSRRPSLYEQRLGLVAASASSPPSSAAADAAPPVEPPVQTRRRSMTATQPPKSPSSLQTGPSAQSALADSSQPRRASSVGLRRVSTASNTSGAASATVPFALHTVTDPRPALPVPPPPITSNSSSDYVAAFLTALHESAADHDVAEAIVGVDDEDTTWPPWELVDEDAISLAALRAACTRLDALKPVSGIAQCLLRTGFALVQLRELAREGLKANATRTAWDAFGAQLQAITEHDKDNCWPYFETCFKVPSLQDERSVLPPRPGSPALPTGSAVSASPRTGQTDQGPQQSSSPPQPWLHPLCMPELWSMRVLWQESAAGFQLLDAIAVPTHSPELDADACSYRQQYLGALHLAAVAEELQGIKLLESSERAALVAHASAPSGQAYLRRGSKLAHQSSWPVFGMPAGTVSRKFVMILALARTIARLRLAGATETLAAVEASPFDDGQLIVDRATGTSEVAIVAIQSSAGTSAFSPRPMASPQGRPPSSRAMDSVRVRDRRSFGRSLAHLELAAELERVASSNPDSDIRQALLSPMERQLGATPRDARASLRDNSPSRGADESDDEEVDGQADEHSHEAAAMQILDVDWEEMRSALDDLKRLLSPSVQGFAGSSTSPTASADHANPAAVARGWCDAGVCAEILAWEQLVAQRQIVTAAADAILACLAQVCWTSVGLAPWLAGNSAESENDDAGAEAAAAALVSHSLRDIDVCRQKLAASIEIARQSDVTCRCGTADRLGGEWAPSAQLADAAMCLLQNRQLLLRIALSRMGWEGARLQSSEDDWMALSDDDAQAVACIDENAKVLLRHSRALRSSPMGRSWPVSAVRISGPSAPVGQPDKAQWQTQVWFVITEDPSALAMQLEHDAEVAARYHTSTVIAASLRAQLENTIPYVAAFSRRATLQAGGDSGGSAASEPGEAVRANERLRAAWQASQSAESLAACAHLSSMKVCGRLCGAADACNIAERPLLWMDIRSTLMQALASQLAQMRDHMYAGSVHAAVETGRALACMIRACCTGLQALQRHVPGDTAFAAVVRLCTEPNPRPDEAARDSAAPFPSLDDAVFRCLLALITAVHNQVPVTADDAGAMRGQLQGGDRRYTRSLAAPGAQGSGAQLISITEDATEDIDELLDEASYAHAYIAELGPIMKTCYRFVRAGVHIAAASLLARGVRMGGARAPSSGERFSARTVHANTLGVMLDLSRCLRFDEVPVPSPSTPMAALLSAGNDVSFEVGSAVGYQASSAISIRTLELSADRALGQFERSAENLIRLRQAVAASDWKLCAAIAYGNASAPVRGVCGASPSALRSSPLRSLLAAEERAIDATAQRAHDTSSPSGNLRRTMPTLACEFPDAAGEEVKDVVSLLSAFALMEPVHNALLRDGAVHAARRILSQNAEAMEVDVEFVEAVCAGTADSFAELHHALHLTRDVSNVTEDVQSALVSARFVCDARAALAKRAWHRLRAVLQVAIAYDPQVADLATDPDGDDTRVLLEASHARAQSLDAMTHRVRASVHRIVVDLAAAAESGGPLSPPHLRRVSGLPHRNVGEQSRDGHSVVDAADYSAGAQPGSLPALLPEAKLELAFCSSLLLCAEALAALRSMFGIPVPWPQISPTEPAGGPISVLGPEPGRWQSTHEHGVIPTHSMVTAHTAELRHHLWVYLPPCAALNWLIAAHESVHGARGEAPAAATIAGTDLHVMLRPAHWAWRVDILARCREAWQVLPSPAESERLLAAISEAVQTPFASQDGLSKSCTQQLRVALVALSRQDAMLAFLQILEQPGWSERMPARECFHLKRVQPTTMSPVSPAALARAREALDLARSSRRVEVCRAADTLQTLLMHLLRVREAVACSDWRALRLSIAELDAMLGAAERLDADALAAVGLGRRATQVALQAVTEESMAAHALLRLGDAHIEFGIHWRALLRLLRSLNGCRSAETESFEQPTESAPGTLDVSFMLAKRDGVRSAGAEWLRAATQLYTRISEVVSELEDGVRTWDQARLRRAIERASADRLELPGLASVERLAQASPLEFARVRLQGAVAGGHMPAIIRATMFVKETAGVLALPEVYASVLEAVPTLLTLCRAASSSAEVRIEQLPYCVPPDHPCHLSRCPAINFASLRANPSLLEWAGVSNPLPVTDIPFPLLHLLPKVAQCVRALASDGKCSFPEVLYDQMSGLAKAEPQIRTEVLMQVLRALRGNPHGTARARLWTCLAVVVEQAGVPEVLENIVEVALRASAFGASALLRGAGEGGYECLPLDSTSIPAGGGPHVFSRTLWSMYENTVREPGLSASEAPPAADTTAPA